MVAYDGSELPSTMYFIAIVHHVCSVLTETKKDGTTVLRARIVVGLQKTWDKSL